MRHAGRARKGSGNFIGFSPPEAKVTGVELDPVTAGIAATLYPHAVVRTESFAETRDPDGTYDLVIGNVPFGKVVLHDRRHNAGGHSIHNHFIIKSLHLTRPGGLVMALTSRYTMDARNPAARREIAALADLVGAIRLPSDAHQRACHRGNAGHLVRTGFARRLPRWSAPARTARRQVRKPRLGPHR